VSCKKPAEYRYGDHTADVLIQAFGCDIEEAFKNAAIAFADLTFYSDKVDAVDKKVVEVESEDLEGLLFRWIDELLYIFEAEKFAISRKIDLTIEKGDVYKLFAIVYGEKYSQEKHGFTGLIVKAMTYHMMEIKQIEDYWLVQYVVDI